MRIWIDMASPPQVMFFSAIIPQLESLGHDVFATALGFENCPALLRQHGVEAAIVSEKYQSGYDDADRVSGWKKRNEELRRFMAGRPIDLAVSYGSSNQAIVAGQMGWPLFTGTDYEFVRLNTMRFAARVMIPEVVPATRFLEAGVSPRAIRRYPGQKEDAYLCDFDIDYSVRDRLGIDDEETVVVYRPEAPFAHYLDDYARGLPRAILERLVETPGLRVLLMPRSELQRQEILQSFGHHPHLTVIGEVLCGPSLIAASDMVIGGGGTMVREAAALRVPVASCFEGPFGGMDSDLVRKGKLVRINSVDDPILLNIKRRATRLANRPDTRVRDMMVNEICATPEHACQQALGVLGGQPG
jgi:predicted glycosyltransferase